MSLDTAAPKFTERSWSGAVSLALRLVLVLALLAIIIQAAIVVRARPQDLITGAYGMADIIRRAMPPDFSKIDMVWWPALETIDLGIFGTVGGVIMALPLAVLIVPSILPSLLGIALYRLDENIRSSLVLGFVGAGGIGFELLSAMSLFQYQLVSLLLIVTFVIVIAAERLSALLRARLG